MVEGRRGLLEDRPLTFQSVTFPSLPWNGGIVHEVGGGLSISSVDRRCIGSNDPVDQPRREDRQ